MAGGDTPYKYKGIVVAALIMTVWSGHLLWTLQLSDPGLARTLVHILIQANLSVGLFITAHDAMHGTVAPHHRRLNDAFGAAALLIYAGFFFDRTRRLHHAHHRHPASAGDPDYGPAGDERLGPWFWSFLTQYYSWKNFAVMNILILVMWVYAGSFQNILIFYAAPAWISALQLFYFGTYLPHRTPEGGHDHPHRARSNDYPVWLSFLTCYHFGYHEEHHDRPSVPWWRLPKARRAALGLSMERLR